MAELKLTSTEKVILAVLIGGELYGLEIIRCAEERDPGRTLSIGGLYTLLHRMESKGLVASRWGEETEDRKGARRRYYRATGIGERALLAERQMLSGLRFSQSEA